LNTVAGGIGQLSNGQLLKNGLRLGVKGGWGNRGENSTRVGKLSCKNEKREHQVFTTPKLPTGTGGSGGKTGRGNRRKGDHRSALKPKGGQKSRKQKDVPMDKHGG